VADETPDDESCRSKQNNQYTRAPPKKNHSPAPTAREMAKSLSEIRRFVNKRYHQRRRGHRDREENPSKRWRLALPGTAGY
jgi:hypothetical protein